MSKIETNKLWFSTLEAAQLIGISRITVFRWIRAGKIKAQKVGKVYLIPRDEIKTYIKPSQADDEHKKTMEHQVDLVIKHYGETLKMLGAE